MMLPHTWLAPALGGLLLLLSAATANAQLLQLAPFIGYRAGGDLYEVVTGTALEVNGASAGLTADIFVREGTSATFLYSRQDARVQPRAVPGRENGVARLLPIEHWHFGGSQELNGGPIRPFLGVTAGLTRFAGGVSEVRFSAAGHAGVKFLPSDHLGARIDARVYAVFIEGGIGRVACGNGFCAFAVDALIAWQGEFTAALMFSF